MTNLKNTPLLAFVFRATQIAPPLIEMAHRTGSITIFDLSRMRLQAARQLLAKVDNGYKNLHALVSLPAVMDASFGKFLETANITDIWVELNLSLFDDDLDSLFPRLKELSAVCRCFPIISNTDLMIKAVEEQPNVPKIVLKGCEASGFVSRESSLSLYAAACDLLKRKEQNPDIFIWGGIGTPEAAAAFLSTGAKGVVFESLHWLTDMADMDQKVCQQLSELRPEFSKIVGSMFQVPFRVFDKGNSRAVKALNRFIASLDPVEITEQKQRAFVERVQRDCVLPYESGLNRNELVPLGVEACFAQSFVERYGFKTEHAIRSFMQEVQELCEGALEKKKSFLRNPLTEKMGIRHPFIQGAMTWITDRVEFAVDVADAGGLPTLALGLMNRETLAAKLGRLPEVMKDRPYAVNLVALQENPLVDVQLKWINETKPRFVVIGAGDPSMIREIRRKGMEPIYIAPNTELLKLAFQAGARYAICEGNEAGGHIGDLTTLSFSQAVIELRRRDPSLFKDRQVILAGGICDGVTASIAALLGANAIQMGTVYLTTREIVERKALSNLYQEMILTSRFGGTVITGEAAGLPVRSLKTAKTKAIRELERDFMEGGEDEASFRRKLEELTVGSLFIAARGLDRPGGVPIDETLCVEQGQFMCGVCAGIADRIRTVKELHDELVEALMTPVKPWTHFMSKGSVTQSEHELSVRAVPSPGNRSVNRARHSSDDPERIAITGLSMINSLGNSPHEIWHASLDMKSGVTRVPPSRWNHKNVYDPRPNIPERTYCNVGAFKKAPVFRKTLGISPHDFKTMSGSTKETLYLAQKAIAHSGILDSDIPRERIGVLVSQNSGECPGTLEEIIVRVSRKAILDSIKETIHLNPELEFAIEDVLKAGRMAVDDTTLTGRLNATAAGFICNQYGLMGPSCAITAACASSLVALYSAVQMIRNGSIDAAVVGGGEETLTPLHFLEFSALGALAGLSGVERPPEGCSRPFDAGRDGFVLGEGGGMIVIERESLAVRRGAHVHAYVTGVGGSNTPTGLVEPSSLGAEAAIRASFRDAACYGPKDVDLIECHATGTVQGDLEEARAIRSVFAGSGRTMLTSFKSQIGHTLGAAGISNLIRGIMAMKDGVFPPTINCDHPDKALGIEGLGLVLCRGPSEWKPHNDRPRRAQINAFGFGGFNYVAQLEESRKTSDRVMVLPERESRALLHSHEESPEPTGVSFFRSEIKGEGVRLALVCETLEKAKAKINEIRMEDGNISNDRLGYLAKRGIHLGIERGTPSPAAFVFPGQGAQYSGMGKELYARFPTIRETMDRFSAVADFDLLQVLFEGEGADLKKTLWLQPALFSFEHAMSQHLMSLGISPVAVAGHSLGEFTALCAAGVFSAEEGFRLVAKRGACMDRVASMDGETSAMIAVNAPLDLLQELVLEWENVYICNINSPNQVVVGGKTKAVSALGRRLKETRYRVSLLDVGMAFHTPVMSQVRAELEDFLTSIPFHAPRIPVISNTTGRPFPSNPAEIKKIVLAHLESPVHWMQCVKTLWSNCGVRVFVEIGPGDVLSGLIAETLESPECLPTCLPLAESKAYRTALARLYTQGNLTLAQDAQLISLPAPKGGPQKGAEGSQELALVRGEGVTDPRSVEGIIRREYAALMSESVGNLLKRCLLNAVRLQYDPSFTEERLEKALGSIPLNLDDHRLGHPSRSKLAALPRRRPQRFSVHASPYSLRPETSDPSGIIEDMIAIIMDATGYERDEIGPDMDLKDELAVRSSRLPMIMDAAQRRFGITIQLEDFMDVRTIRDAAEKISLILSRDGLSNPQERDHLQGIEPQTQGRTKPREDGAAAKRLTFGEHLLQTGRSVPVELTSGDAVVILSAGGSTRLSKKLEGIFSADHGVVATSLAYLKRASDLGAKGFDIRTEKESSRCAARLREVSSLAGLVLVVDEVADNRIKTMEDISCLIRGFFLVLQAFVQSPARKFVFLLFSGQDKKGHLRIISEGLLGMYLSAAWEYGSVQFRSLHLDKETDLGYAIRCALDRSRPTIETIYHGGKAFSSVGRMNRSVFRSEPSLHIGPGDVVVLSGGGRGITAHLARAFTPFGNRVVLLGRTPVDLGTDIDELISKADPQQNDLYQNTGIETPKSRVKRTDPESPHGIGSLEIARILGGLRSSGIDASYMTCDVTDKGQVQAVMETIFRQHGNIHTIIHGAGIIRDALIPNLRPEDVSDVMNVKILGAWHLFQAAKQRGLQCFVALSSIAAVYGNPGQANYASANRALSALITVLAQRYSHVFFKSLILPPIRGAGMAESPEIRELMIFKGMEWAYVHINELMELFCRELFTTRDEAPLVMFMKQPTDATFSRLDLNDLSQSLERMEAGAVGFPKESVPLIDSVMHMDMAAGKVEAHRTFSRKKDLWIEDHKPFRSLKHPMISGVMTIEALMEASKILYPYLQIQGMRNVRFLEWIECPVGIDRDTKIVCERCRTERNQVLCNASLASQDISPTGRSIGRMTVNSTAQVVLSGRISHQVYKTEGFPVETGELDTPPMDREALLQWYRERSEFKGRYCVVTRLNGTGPTCIVGKAMHRVGKDFLDYSSTQYQYSPYLLEAVFHLAASHAVIRDRSTDRLMVPAAIEELTLGRRPEHGQEIELACRMTAEDPMGSCWDAQCLDGAGGVILYARGIQMRWLSAQ